MFSCILYHYCKLLYKLCRTPKEILTLLLRDMVVNPIFPKCHYYIYVEWLSDDSVNHVEPHYLRMEKNGSERKDAEIKNKHTDLAPAEQQANQNL